MTTKEIYLRMDVPLGLQDHMLTVAALVTVIKDNWSGEVKVDWPAVTAAALLHDLGNVVKFDLDKFPQLLGPELPQINYWREKRAELVAKYSADDHATTDAMLAELSISPVIRQIISDKSFGNAIVAAASGSFESKILLYCDLRVLPERIGTLDERIAEIKTRLLKYSQRSDFGDLVTACHQIETETLSNLSGSLENLLERADIEEMKISLRNLQVA